MTQTGSSAIALEELELYVTMRCNLDCDFCSVNANEHTENELPKERFLELIDEAVTMGLEEAHFSGGEPLLRPDLEEMVRHAADRGVHTRVITNGQLLDERRCGRLKAAGLDEIMISLDGFEETHNRFRGSGRAYERTLRAIRASLEAGFPTRVSMVVFQENQGQVIELIRTMSELGVQVISCFLGAPLGRGALHRKESVLSAEAWRTLRTEICAAVSELPESTQVICEQGFLFQDETQFDRSGLKGRGVGCGTLMDSFDFLIVRSDGNLYQCVFFVTDGEPIGNVAEMSLRGAIEEAKRQRLYRPFSEPGDRCVGCRQQASCGLGCRGYAYLYTGDWLKTDPRCPTSGEEAPAYLPLCPILKLNARTGRFGGSSEQALATHLDEI